MKPKPFNPARAKRTLDKLWSEYVRRRDGHCTFCGRTEGKLDANHIMSRRHTATRWDVRNGNALCFTCHRRFHDDPPWGAEEAEKHTGIELYIELGRLARQITKFDRVMFEVKKVELERLLASL